ncbi:hypothetical protein LEP1GSC059_0742 [Leptospira noguchii serovar Panama str. CZ214]|uniref:Uncharacterized protein n=1 Tax=Leptospira noguchii serovar Panama str. CZ214 TaxID=1001595 RepID=T0FGM7_9LEPT|nr:hypothetical protein LEP1GSC059_0742 [Leptospira noguchii serovar Panama str. CZ214]
MTLGARLHFLGVCFLLIASFFLLLFTGKSEIVYYISISSVPIYLTFKYAFTRIDHAPHFLILLQFYF